MSRVHGKVTVILLNAIDISQHCDNTSEEDGQDSHDLTTYLQNRHVFGGGLGNGTYNIGGFYDSSTSTGPRAVIKPLSHSPDTVEFIYRPEGTGSGKPQTKVQVLVLNYKQTAPVADYIKWTADLQCSGDLDETAQA